MSLATRIGQEFNTLRGEVSEVSSISKNYPLIDFSRVESYVKEDGTRWLKNDGTGTDGEMLSGQMLEFSGYNYLAFDTDKITNSANCTILFSIQSNDDGTVLRLKDNSYIKTFNSYLQLQDINATVTTTTTLLADGNYKRVALLFNGTNCSIYVNGVFTESISFVSSTIYLWTVNQFSNFIGNIGNVSLIDTELTADDIALDYAQPELILGVATNTIQSPFSFDTNDVLSCFPLNEGTMGGGYVYDVKNLGNLDIGVNKVTNGTFDTDTGWALDTGWTISGGKLNAVNGGSFTTQSGVFDTSKTQAYRIEYTISNYISGEVRTLSGASVNGVLNSGNGTYVDYVIVPQGAPNTYLYFRGNGTFNGSIDNVIVEETYNFYPISNYDSTMWTNADNLPYGIQQTLLVKDDISNFVTGISKYAVDSVTGISPTLSPYYDAINLNGTDAVLSSITTTSFNIVNTSGAVTTYPRVYTKFNSDVTFESNTFYRLSFDYVVNSGTVVVTSTYLPSGGNITTTDYTLVGSGTKSFLYFNTIEKLADSNELFLSFDTTTYNTFDIDISNIKIEKVEYSELPQLECKRGEVSAQTPFNLSKEELSLSFVYTPEQSYTNYDTVLYLSAPNLLAVYGMPTYIRATFGSTTKDVPTAIGQAKHFVFTIKDNIFSIYADGKLVSQHISTTAVALSQTLYLGGNTSGDLYRNKLLKNITMYNKALNQFEVKELYNNIKTNAPSLALP